MPTSLYAPEAAGFPTRFSHTFVGPFPVSPHEVTRWLGAVVLRAETTGFELLLVYVSRRLADSKNKCHLSELESLAVVWSLQKFRRYLDRRQFTAVTDISALF